MGIATITAVEASERLRAAGMRITQETLRAGILSGVFPFGIAIKTEKSMVCWVFTHKLDAWIKEYLEGVA